MRDPRYEPDQGLFEAVETALNESAGTGEASAAIGAALTAVYHHQRKHADEYRDTDLYKIHQRDRYNGKTGIRQAAFDRGYVSGIVAAAADVAKLLGVDEAELISTSEGQPTPATQS